MVSNKLNRFGFSAVAFALAAISLSVSSAGAQSKSENAEARVESALENAERIADEADQVLDDGEEIIDVVKKWAGPKPPPSEAVKWANTQKFDLTVNQSLARQYRKVEITDTNFATDKVPQRLQNWFDFVEKKKGKVGVCPVKKGEEGLFSLIKLAVKLVKRVVLAIDQYLTYRPAKYYHAALLVEVEDVEKFDPEAHHEVYKVVFYHKRKFGDLPKSCSIQD